MFCDRMTSKNPVAKSGVNSYTTRQYTIRTEKVVAESLLQRIAMEISVGRHNLRQNFNGYFHPRLSNSDGIVVATFSAFFLREYLRRNCRNSVVELFHPNFKMKHHHSVPKKVLATEYVVAILCLRRPFNDRRISSQFCRKNLKFPMDCAVAIPAFSCSGTCLGRGEVDLIF